MTDDLHPDRAQETPSGSRDPSSRPDRAGRACKRIRRKRRERGRRLDPQGLEGRGAAALWNDRGGSRKSGARPPRPAPPILNTGFAWPGASRFRKLKASLRKASSGGLTINPPHQGAQRFKAVERIGRAFRLRAVGTLPERFLGRRLDPRPARVREPDRRRACRAGGATAPGRKEPARNRRGEDHRTPEKETALTQIADTDAATCPLVGDSCGFPGVSLSFQHRTHGTPDLFNGCLAMFRRYSWRSSAASPTTTPRLQLC